MYVGKVEPVEIPKSGGKTRRNTSGYIWWITESKWDNDLGYTKDNRITIGKEVPGRPGWIVSSLSSGKISFQTARRPRERPSCCLVGKGEFYAFGCVDR